MVSSEATGEKTRKKKYSESVVPREMRSLYFLAMLFGSISPRKNMAMVMAMVLHVTTPASQRRVTSTVT